MTTIALVGQGYMARTHAAAYAALGLGDDIVYVCAPRPGAPFEHAPRARSVARLETVLADQAVDVLSICTPPRRTRTWPSRLWRPASTCCWRSPSRWTWPGRGGSPRPLRSPAPR